MISDNEKAFVEAHAYVQLAMRGVQGALSATGENERNEKLAVKRIDDSIAALLEASDRLKRIFYEKA